MYEETWSITSTPDGGFVLGSGSGTHCSEVPAEMRSKCLSANMESWQSLVTKISATGKLVWQRVDTPNENAPNPENAAEYVTVNADGTYLVTHDETLGMGFTLLASDTKPDTSGAGGDKDKSDNGSTTSTKPITIVLIGDSMSEYAKQSVDKYCTNAKSTNKGIGGSTAEQVCGA